MLGLAIAKMVAPFFGEKYKQHIKSHERWLMMQDVKSRVEGSKNFHRSGGRAYENSRSYNAEQLGLTSIGEVSAFADLVAVHPKFPDMVIKAVDSGDASVLYARAIKAGRIVSKHCPVIFDIHDIEGCTFIYMERLKNWREHPENISERIHEVSRGIKFGNNCSEIYEGSSILDWFEQLHNELSVSDWYSDFDGELNNDNHTGNIMYRESDGELVFIDPVSGRLDTSRETFNATMSYKDYS